MRSDSPQRVQLLLDKRVIAVMLLTTASLAGCTLPFGQTSSPSTPPGWTDVTPPTHQYVANYAYSPDVPGLILACIGDRASDIPGATITPGTGNQPVGPAKLWRTRDGGAHWQTLALSGLRSDCSVSLPRGGNGTIFATVQGGSYGTGTLVVSHDAGDTWRTVETSSLGESGYGAFLGYDLTTRAVYDGTTLYSFGRVPPADAPLPPGEAYYAFSASADDGGTWTYIEQTYDPHLIGYETISIARDYRSPAAWFRVLISASSSTAPQGIYSPILLQHSADGGQTWQTLGAAGPSNLALPQHSTMVAHLLTTPQSPSRLCLLSLAEGVSHLGDKVVTTAEVLDASDDAGSSWTGAVTRQGSVSVYSVRAAQLAMDERGNCYVGTTATGTAFGMVPGEVTTFFRMPPGVNAKPETIATLQNQYADSFGVYHGADGKERLVAELTPIAPNVCASPCPTPTPEYIVAAPRLLSIKP